MKNSKILKSVVKDKAVCKSEEKKDNEVDGWPKFGFQLNIKLKTINCQPTTINQPYDYHFCNTERRNRKNDVSHRFCQLHFLYFR